MTLMTALLPFAKQAPDPADVRPGLIGFLMFLGLLVAVVLLWLSMRKQLKKVNFEERDTREGGGTGAGSGKNQPTRA
ncbi:MAG: hypothetical protein ACTHOK_14845 [Nocardioidaceae bacterium]